MKWTLEMMKRSEFINAMNSNSSSNQSNFNSKSKEEIIEVGTVQESLPSQSVAIPKKNKK